MESIKLLEKRVENGSLEIIQAVGVPRSMSTAFCRAFNETPQPSIYVNEPFNRNATDPESAAAALLAALEGEHEPTIVIVKNMASYLGTEGFRWLQDLSRGTIWNIRHPLRQMGSLLTRLVNDFEGKSGDTALQQHEIYPYLDEVTELLISSPRSTQFSKTGWQAIADLHCEQELGRSVVIDGEDFVERPKDTLEEACDMLAVEFAAKMVNGWSSQFVNVVNVGNEQETARSEWTAEAWNSNGVSSQDRPSLDMDRLPAPIRLHIEQVAMPAYAYLRAA